MRVQNPIVDDQLYFLEAEHSTALIIWTLCSTHVVLAEFILSGLCTVKTGAEALSSSCFTELFELGGGRAAGCLRTVIQHR